MGFSGTYTALVTPFAADGSVDYAALNRLIEQQIAGGVQGIVAVGTTGESPTLRTHEHLKVIEQVIEQVAGRCKVIAGTGANATDEALELTLASKAFGADGTLQVTPYYNKPTNRGLIAHFSAVADLGLPVVLYNVPGRTSREIPLEVVKALSDHPHVVSIKEAAGSVERVKQIREICDLEILSGDDALALPMIKEGAIGLISVASNIMPAQVVALVDAARGGDWEQAQTLHDRYCSFFDALFIETNPIPVKAVMAAAGWIEEMYRLPLCTMEPEHRAQLLELYEGVRG